MASDLDLNHVGAPAPFTRRLGAIQGGRWGLERGPRIIDLFSLACSSFFFLAPQGLSSSFSSASLSSMSCEFSRGEVCVCVRGWMVRKTIWAGMWILGVGGVFLTVRW